MVRYEAGYDVTQGPKLWGRMRQNGEMDRVSNFFSGDHSRPTERIRNIEREIQVERTLRQRYDDHARLRAIGCNSEAKSYAALLPHTQA